MDIARVVPNITTTRIDESREFYCGLFGFEVAMDMDWIVTLASPSTDAAQISLVRGDRGAGVDDRTTLSIDVADVDAVYKRAQANGCDIPYDLTDEPWGVRRFHVRDPNGVLLNVLTHLNASAIRMPLDDAKEDDTKRKLMKLAVVCLICVGLVTVLAMFVQSLNR